MNKRPLSKLPCRILAIELEPTHYKSDLWNAAVNSDLSEVFVIYTQAKNWLPDGGHNYEQFPKSQYKHLVLSGKNIIGVCQSSYLVIKNIIMYKPTAVIICGYSQVQTVSALMAAFLFRRPFLLFVDEFNNNRPPGNFSYVKYIVRETLRKFCFKFSSAVLVCGKRGKESALVAGCASNKIVDYPYVIDSSRIMSDCPESVPEECLFDLSNGTTIIFFSGRMILRKGLPTLLSTIKDIKETKHSWVLWIEGDGPDINIYKEMAKEFGIENSCRFLGFCQYDLHSWLLRSSDIVVIPSLEDNWAIVVDEGLQLSKIVISSDATGAGYDRIIDKYNGYLFPAGDSASLTNLLSELLNGEIKDIDIRTRARESKTNVKPIDNINTLIEIIRNEK